MSSDNSGTTAEPKSFHVIDRRPADDRWDFHVKVYGPDGKLSLHAWNACEASMQIEVSTLLSRGYRPCGQTAETAAKVVRKLAAERSAS